MPLRQAVNGDESCRPKVKGKHVAGERGQHGLTGMVLSIGALIGKQAVATVQAAMTEITTPAVWNWCRSN
jgi:hypothetical protein